MHFRDAQAFAELMEIANKKKNGNRLSATELGDSHKKKVSSNGFAFRDLNSKEYSLLVVNAESATFVPKLAINNDCVIIENREVFYSEDLETLLAQHGIDGTKCDILLGNGGEVKNTYLSNFLDGRYDRVHCLFDYDLGGIKMYESLHAALQGSRKTKIMFSMPLIESLCKRPLDYQKPSSSDFNEAIKLASALNLTKLRNNILKASRFFEQEMLLVNIKELSFNE
ncbi:hypothetical protein [Photobacterium kishitanii]|uniref:hypothetical protein n=1 Tax=Photobacterium kishitanii TaxID=318456 RepID=UPI0011B1E4AD|nr:hypothetical protein [Photobacterium kishitanii]